MPFLRAALLPHKDTVAKSTTPKLHKKCDKKIAEIVNAWIREDDFSTAQELAYLGL